MRGSVPFRGWFLCGLRPFDFFACRPRRTPCPSSTRRSSTGPAAPPRSSPQRSCACRLSVGTTERPSQGLPGSRPRACAHFSLSVVQTEMHNFVWTFRFLMVNICLQLRSKKMAHMQQRSCESEQTPQAAMYSTKSQARSTLCVCLSLPISQPVTPTHPPTQSPRMVHRCPKAQLNSPSPIGSFRGRLLLALVGARNPGSGLGSDFAILKGHCLGQGQQSSPPGAAAFSERPAPL